MCIKIIPSVIHYSGRTKIKLEISLTGNEFDRIANEREILREMDRLKKRLTRITENYTFDDFKNDCAEVAK